ncbi:MAG TPA: hypothetical protein VKU41_02775 [Polyangiaceae bacterium]|nr:hypothetical protein [Polyangiaceae bacterium]
MHTLSCGSGTPRSVRRIGACSIVVATLGAGCAGSGSSAGPSSTGQPDLGGAAHSGRTGSTSGAISGAGAASVSGTGGGVATGNTGGAGSTGGSVTGSTSASGGSSATSGGATPNDGGGAPIASSGSSGDGGAVNTGGPIPHGACLDGITDFESDGPFMVKTQVVGSINYYVPSVPSGCKVPVVHLANGTGAVCADYQAALNRLATQGFLTACYENANTGAGDQGLQALDTAFMTFPDLADDKFGSTGHSQGGQAAFTVLALAEKKYGTKLIYAGLAMEPASGFGTQPMGATWQQLYAAIKSPMFMFSGLGTDGLVSQAWVQMAYDATSPSEEAYFWTANGATHIPVPNAQEEEISIPWFRWKLLGDQKACAYFKAIPMTDTKWAQVAAKNAQACH